MSFLKQQDRERRLLLIDGHSMIYRSFYAIRGLRTSDGFPSNAIFGYTRALLKVLREWPSQYAALALDAKGDTVRHEAYSEYKANRPEMPDDLAVQLPKIEQITESLGVRAFKKEGYEADDLIATLATEASEEGLEVLIVSNDKDLMQLVGDKIKMLVPENDGSESSMTIFDAETVEEKFGVTPSQMVDFLALQGDSSDNIPGVPKIGEVRAQRLLQEFNNLDSLYGNLQKVDSDYIRSTLSEHKKQAYQSKQLVELHSDLDLQYPLDKTKLQSPSIETARSIFRELEFGSLLEELPDNQVDVQCQLVDSTEEFHKLLDQLGESKIFSFDLETTSINPLKAKPIGLAVSFHSGSGFYLPLDHDSHHLEKEKVLNDIKPYFENPTLAKIGQNLKYDSIVLKRHGVDLKGIAFDSMLASYLLKPSKNTHNLKEIAKSYLDRDVSKFDELDLEDDDFRSLPLPEAMDYAVKDAEVIWPLKKILEDKLRERNQLRLLREVELPLVPILRDMEIRGVRFEPEKLKEGKAKLEKQLEELQAQINKLAGAELNPNSPKQVRNVLFDELDLPVLERTKTGPSTNARVLRELSDQHPLPEKIIEYRELHKLLNTYLTKLPETVNEETGRIHTSFNQTATSTGRLSSSEPNLQNIPKLSEGGKELRKAFLASPGFALLGADYSQIELRMLAHLSGDRELIETFRREEDLHDKTAAELFDVEPGNVTSKMRNRAKRVNYGIVYGITGYGLSKDLGIEQKEAAQYIERFFRLYPQAKTFIDQLIQKAEQNHYAETFLGRRRYLSNITSRDWNKRHYDRRNAINTPIQGGAADLMKLAMIEVGEAIQEGTLSSRLLLQVHDELILESPQDRTSQEAQRVREIMEGVLNLQVPLKVDIEVGSDWSQL